jgi:proline dehydrogenase
MEYIMALNIIIKNAPKKLVITPLFNYFTAGENIISLQHKITDMNKQKLLPIADYIKEFVQDDKEINNIISEYNQLGQVSNLEYIAIKLSSFKFDENKIDFVIKNLVKNNKRILIDAEDVKNQDNIEKITDKMIFKYNLEKPIIYKTYQMYRKDSLNKISNDIKKFPNNGLKIVRGAYHNSDKNTGKLFIKKKDTDYAYSEAMKIIFENNYSAFICTHNKENINYMLDNYNLNKNIYHASLYGFINTETEKLIKKGIPTYKYLPYGNINDALPYLTRRVYENPRVLIHLF